MALPAAWRETIFQMSQIFNYASIETARKEDFIGVNL
jgi:hypothetical protein